MDAPTNSDWSSPTESPRLVMESGPWMGQAFPLIQAWLTLGRSADNDIVLEDAEISRHHARIRGSGDNWILEDLGSTNGTYVNGASVTGPYLLHHADVIGLSERATFTFRHPSPMYTEPMPPSRIPIGAAPATGTGDSGKPLGSNSWKLAGIAATIILGGIACLVVLILYGYGGSQSVIAPAATSSGLPTAAADVQTPVTVLSTSIPPEPSAQVTVAAGDPSPATVPADARRLVAAGEAQSCLITPAGDIECWGSNLYGRLGDGGLESSNVPVALPKLLHPAQAIACGERHCCAQTDVGQVWCWGGNQFGQLGNNSTQDSDVPVMVSNLATNLEDITCGKGFTCALTTGGQILCWGDNSGGQLGQAGGNKILEPAAVAGLAEVKAIAAGDAHTCAVNQSGEVWCWGMNGYGQLGTYSGFQTPSPILVEGLSKPAVSVAAGSAHTCVLDIEGDVFCWGDNIRGQLGNGSDQASLAPVQVLDVSNVIDLAASQDHTCALITGGGLKCWGANLYGQAGNGSTTDVYQPVQVGRLKSGVISVAAGYEHTCAMTAEHQVYCWGNNADGQLGDGTVTDRAVPTLVAVF